MKFNSQAPIDSPVNVQFFLGFALDRLASVTPEGTVDIVSLIPNRGRCEVGTSSRRAILECLRGHKVAYAPAYDGIYSTLGGRPNERHFTIVRGDKMENIKGRWHVVAEVIDHDDADQIKVRRMDAADAFIIA